MTLQGAMLTLCPAAVAAPQQFDSRSIVAMHSEPAPGAGTEGGVNHLAENKFSALLKSFDLAMGLIPSYPITMPAAAPKGA